MRTPGSPEGFRGYPGLQAGTPLEFMEGKRPGGRESQKLIRRFWPRDSIDERVGRDGEMFGQGFDVLECEVAFAAENHGAQGAVNTQRFGEIGGAQAMGLQERSQGFKASGFGSAELGLFPVFDQPAKEIEIVRLVCCEGVAGHGVGDVGDVAKIDGIMDGARGEQLTEADVIAREGGEFERATTGFHRVSFQRSWRYAASHPFELRVRAQSAEIKATSLAVTSSTVVWGRRPMSSARRSCQSTERAWSASTTPAMGSPSGTATSKG